MEAEHEPEHQLVTAKPLVADRLPLAVDERESDPAPVEQPADGALQVQEEIPANRLPADTRE